MKKKLLVFLGIACLFSFLPSAIKGSVYTISPCEFIPEAHGEKQIKITDWGSYFFREAGSTEQIYYAPVHLPDNIIIKWLRLHFIDDSTSYNVEIHLFRANKFNKATDEIYAALSSSIGTSPSVQWLTNATPINAAHTKTNLKVFNYYIVLNMTNPGGADVQFIGATIGW